MNTNDWVPLFILEKLIMLEKNLCKLNYSYGKVSHALKVFERNIE